MQKFRKAVVVVLAGFVFLSLPGSADAHAELVSSSPGDGEELRAPPTELRLVFSERPDPRAVSVRLFDRNGRELDLGEPKIDAQFQTTVTIPIKQELRPGPYTVVWSVVSEEDEHPASREFVFGVEEPAGRPSVTAGELRGDGGGGALLGRFLALSGILLLIGAAVQARWFALPEMRMAHLVSAGALIASAGLILDALFGASVRIVTPGPLAWLDPALVAGLVMAGVAAVAGTIARALNRRRSAQLWLLVLLAGFGLAWLLASKSHAPGVGILPWVSVVWQGIDLAVTQPELYPMFPHLFELARQLNVLVAAIHTFAVSAWIGGLLVAGIAGLSREAVSRWHPRFSRFALRSFFVVALTGLYQAVLYLSSPQSLVATDYGLAILGKHVFVVGVLGLAAANRFLVAPAMRAGTGRLRERAVAVVRTEAALGVAVVAAAVLLAATPPARPPTDIFLAPDMVAGFSDERQTVAADRGPWELVVSRQSSTRHSFTVRGPIGPAEEGVLLLQGPGATPQRELRLERSGASLAAEGLLLTRDGPWEASLRVAGGEISFSFDIRAGHVLARDRNARSLWDRAISQTESRMRSARMIDVLTDGLSLMLFAHHELVAPDREHLDILRGGETISIGDRRYLKEAGGGWRLQELGFPFSWPDYAFLDPVVGVRIAGESTQAGLDMTVLAGYDPVSSVGYEIWVGKEDGLIHRLVMGLPGHYMVNAYYDVNAPLSIEPPV